MMQLIQETELMEWSGYKHRDALVNWLRHHGIPYILGNKGRVCVTSDAVNLPLLTIQTVANNDDIEF